MLFDRGFEEIGFIGSIYATSGIRDRYCAEVNTKAMVRVA